MANHSSTKKSIRQTQKKTLINKSRLSRIKTYIKKVEFEISNDSKERANEALIKAHSEIMKGVGKKIIMLNTASRKISRLSKRIKDM